MGEKQDLLRFGLSVSITIMYEWFFFSPSLEETYTAIRKKETYPDNSATMSSSAIHDVLRILVQDFLIHRLVILV